MNNRTAREVEINLGKDDRVIEIIGTQMRQWDIATVKEEAAQIFVTKTASILGNVSGEVWVIWC